MTINLEQELNRTLVHEMIYIIYELAKKKKSHEYLLWDFF